MSFLRTVCVVGMAASLGLASWICRADDKVTQTTDQDSNDAVTQTTDKDSKVTKKIKHPVDQVTTPVSKPIHPDIATTVPTHGPFQIPGATNFLAPKLWQQNLPSLPRPARGCFKISFPDTTWKAISCVPAPRVPYHSGRRLTPFSIGGGGTSDYAAQELPGLINYAVGSFDSISAGITESGKNPNKSNAVEGNSYSLQLNTNTFTTAACAGALSGSPCVGWQQFIFSNEPESSTAFIQYWLLSYDTTCPSGWAQSNDTTTGEIDCFRNDTSAGTPVPFQAVSNLANVKLIGAASGSGDGAILVVDRDAYLVAGDNFLGVSQGWSVAEFNIFGDGNFSDATFGPNTTMTVRTTVDGGSGSAPSCELASFTGETNNLSLSGSPEKASEGAPAIVFTQTNGPASPAGCAVTNGTGGSLQLVSGEKFVEFASDTAGLNHYSINGAMCVVHSPGCPGNAFTGMFGVAHNGKDHYFPASAPLPAGVALEGVSYTVFWPAGIDHTDRGGVGSKGSYGSDSGDGIQNSPPFYSVHWENACQASTSADWSGLNLTYQVSFLISVPDGVTVDGAMPITSPVANICRAGDKPVANNTVAGPVVSSFEAYLHSSAPANGGFIPWAAVFPPVGVVSTTSVDSWTVQSITNDNSFDIFLVGKDSNSDDCFQSGHGTLMKSGSSITDLTSLYSSNHPPLGLVACTAPPLPSEVKLTIKYLH